MSIAGSAQGSGLQVPGGGSAGATGPHYCMSPFWSSSALTLEWVEGIWDCYKYVCWVGGKSCLRAVMTAQLYHSSVLGRGWLKQNCSILEELLGLLLPKASSDISHRVTKVLSIRLLQGHLGCLHNQQREEEIWEHGSVDQREMPALGWDKLCSRNTSFSPLTINWACGIQFRCRGLQWWHWLSDGWIQL